MPQTLPRLCILLALLQVCRASLVSRPVSRFPQPDLAVSRRSALVGFAVSIATPLASHAESAAAAASTIRQTADSLHKFIDDKEIFLKSFDSGADISKIKLPPSVPFTTFQALEKTAPAEFMEIAIDYAEAARNARDLTRLAKITQEKVTVSRKEAGKPREYEEKSLGEAGGLAPASDYAKRAIDEIIGASVALDAAIAALDGK